MAPIRVGIVNDYDIVVAGLAQMLTPFSDRVEIVELDSGLPVRNGVDVILHDTFSMGGADRLTVNRLQVGESRAKVVIFTWNLDRQLRDEASRSGVSGYVYKGIEPADLVSVLEQVSGGARVFLDGEGCEVREDVGRWPGDTHGLTARESEILSLICQGLTNADIARQVFVSENTVKTMIRHTYRKIKVVSRSQAVGWGWRNGMRRDMSRKIWPAGHPEG